jgi:hypothetical protein
VSLRGESFRRPVMAVVLPTCVALTSGCASIVSGGSQEITFRSNPGGALVTIDGKPYGLTPITVMMKRKSGLTAAFTHDGFKPLTITLQTQINGWFLGNILIGGLIGSTTDGVTGAMNEYSPNQYMVTLDPENTNPVEAKTMLAYPLKARQFVVANYDYLLIDLSKSHGEYLNGLLDLLPVPVASRADAIKAIQGLADANKNPADLADKIVATFFTN